MRFESLYRSSRDDVYAYVMTLLRDSAAAEDVTALAFERAYRRRRTFDRRKGEERPGCSASPATPPSTSSAAVSGWPAWSSIPPPPWTLRSSGSPVPTRTRSSCAGPRCAMPWPTCPRADRELIALKFHAGLANSEIARVLGVSESNAGTMLYRTIQKLRKACNAPV